MTANLLDALAALSGCTCDKCTAKRGHVRRSRVCAGDHQCKVCVGLDFTGTGLACPYCARGAVKR